MYMTYRTTIKEAIDENVDFAIFGGDFFHRKDVDARALKDAEKGLEELGDENIPLVAVEGNHDSSIYKKDLTWLEYLHAKGSLILLEANLLGEGQVFEKHDEENPGASSGFVDIGNVRIFGLQYLGQRTSEYLSTVGEGIQEVNEKFGKPEFTILVGHFGIEGHIPGMVGGVSYNDLADLEEVVDYLALGHLHKNYSHGDWVFNPGSLEAHSVREANWDLGYYLVDIDEEEPTVDHIYSKRRPYFSIKFQVDSYETPRELRNGLAQEIEDKKPEVENVQKRENFKKKDQKREPIIDFRLRGLLQFNRTQLDVDELKSVIEDTVKPLKVRVNDATESKEVPEILREFEGEESIRDEEGRIDKERLEHAVFKKLVGKDSRYKENKKEVADFLKSVKMNLQAGESYESIAEEIKQKRRGLFPIQEGDNR
ncbi:metallophosphoesterase [candidate division MSBL1 archaeon SCGC-AAA382A20]|uniref:Metallophosphoesterase n=1 Tax=candidate division MSBL1 archaeon SCGC-AAA382A20 TaxID=1698280 RepID=A0A133VMT1_9EURY|nr:metallophosphoesterase [candidate division MSBL1 archaeon SCGC-AAA382A20]